MSVDLKRGEMLPIHINMTFPSLPCDGQHLSTSKKLPFFYSSSSSSSPLLHFLLLFFFLFLYVKICLFAVLSVDAVDLSGKHEVDLDTSIWKVR